MISPAMVIWLPEVSVVSVSIVNLFSAMVIVPEPLAPTAKSTVSPLVIIATSFEPLIVNAEPVKAILSATL